ncbi:hypothetical protein [Metalysinibacillus jejuensis]|uniref:hypothetical protein n=1 Tax=Metalysinibacillus jejuensis TaxID=914327 RepID=UPI0019147D7A|nr:hypothetical protein [Metalysinibacillus jejuensis]
MCRNEQGAILLLALTLLFLISSAVTVYATLYMTQMSTYEMLEKANIRATINLMRQNPV